jgi:hypothetical protein
MAVIVDTVRTLSLGAGEDGTLMLVALVIGKVGARQTGRQY